VDISENPDASAQAGFFAQACAVDSEVGLWGFAARVGRASGFRISFTSVHRRSTEEKREERVMRAEV
jgi:hypothetical protein